MSATSLASKRRNQSMNYQCDICIVGNGAIGKAAAVGLAQSGLSVVLLCPPGPQRQETASWDTRVFALNRIARDLLSGLRVWDALDHARVAPVESMVVHGDSARAGKLSFDAYSARATELAWIVEDSNLERALDGAVRFAPKLTVVDGLAECIETDAAAVMVALQDGRSIHADLLVGADGRQSWVRGQCDIGITYRPYGQKAVVCNFECEIPHHGAAQQWFTDKQGIVALLPLPGNRVSLVWSAPDALAEQIMRDPLSLLAETLTQLPGQMVGRLTPLQPEAVQAVPLMFLKAESMIAPRVVLAGDAAHAVHPLAGHGMNLGFGDVAALMRILSEREAGRDCGDERLLRRYARARKEDVLLMQLATDGLERLFSADLEPVRVLRNLGMDVLDRLPFIKRRLITHAMGSF
ncbi:FAD-dependent monooxygenase [Lacisediminimonas profundi]|uniref:FAD-dependent monooxygenase n=1 Tax=Lacisediminimonas profundi TaxID=2603856 RepID=UPI001F502824|nr:FAD-dependent monooxygenase [Lacisediminimonas profundi]